MLKKLVIERFKSIKHAELNFGKLNIFIGTNASGKSNLLDSLRVLQGIGYGLTVDEIFNGKSKTSSSLVWQEIRGGSDSAVFKPTTTREYKSSTNIEQSVFEMDTIWKIDGREVAYKVAMNAMRGTIAKESLLISTVDWIYSSDLNSKGATNYATVYTDKVGKPPILLFEKSKAILQQILDRDEAGAARNRKKLIEAFIYELSDIQKLDLIPSVLRGSSRQMKARRMGEHGEDFSAVINNIIKKPEKKEALASWLNLLTPSDIEEIKPLRTKIGDIYFGVREGKKIVYAPSLSDGTLRFAALLTALFQPSLPRMLLIEEIENVIHPTRLKLISELLQSRAAKSETQLFITTHSPLMLAWLDESIYENVFLCYHLDDGSSLIKPLSQISQLNKKIKKFPLEELFAEGWLESVMLKEQE